MAKANLSHEQSLGFQIASLAVQKSGLGRLGQCNVRQARVPNITFDEHGALRDPVVGPRKRVDVFGRTQDGSPIRVGVMVPAEIEHTDPRAQTVNIHGKATWKWELDGDKIVLSSGLNLETGKTF